MRLEYRHHPSGKGGARRGERGLNLGGVVRIIIHHRHPMYHAHAFEAAVHAGKGRQRALDGGQLHAEFQRQRRGAGGVAHIVDAGNAQRQLARASSPRATA